jgi:uncharacterized membrane protein YhhN
VTTHVWVLAVALTVTTLLDWGAVLRRDYDVERITRPTFAVFVLGLAWSFYTDGPVPDTTVAIPLFAALGLSMVGDLFLIRATAVRYRVGLAIFLLANAAFIWAVVELRGRPAPVWAVIAVVVPVVLVLVVLQGRVGKHVVRLAGRDRGLVLLSLLVQMALVVVASIRGDWVVLLAASLLLTWFLVLGHDRFVRARRFAPVLSLIAYHAGQVLIVLGLLR